MIMTIGRSMVHGQFWVTKTTLSRASSTSLRSGFRNRFILNSFRWNALIILVLFFQVVWIVQFTRPNSRHTSALFFPFYISRVTLRVPSKVKPFLLLVTAAMQSLCLQLTAGIDKQRVTLCTEWITIGIFAFLDVTQRRLVVNYRRFRITYGEDRQGSSSPRNIGKSLPI